MTVLNVFIGQIKPGRFDEVVDTARSSAKIVERHGAKSARLVTVAFGAEAYGSVAFAMEYESPEAFGQAYDELMADEEIVRLMSDMRGANTPYLSQQNVTANEVPLASGASEARGNVASVSVSRVVPGKQQAAIDMTIAAREFLLSHGAVNCRLWSYEAAGSLTGAHALVIEYESMGARGKALGSLEREDKGRKILESLSSANSPLTQLSRDVYMEIPL
jgi:hypothetical protein